MGLRRKARELALRFLFSRDFQEPAVNEDIGGALEHFSLHFDIGREGGFEKALPYARSLIEGVMASLDGIDALLAQYSRNWRVERMSLVDRSILRIAIYEICYSPDVPSQVAINEALEIAKRYSVKDSVAFINGILDAAHADGSGRTRRN